MRTRSSKSFILWLYVKTIRAKQGKVHLAYDVINIESQNTLPNAKIYFVAASVAPSWTPM